MNGYNINSLNKISRIASEKASKALSELVCRKINIEVFKTEVKEVVKVSLPIGMEEIVAGIFLPAGGDIRGATLLIFPKESALEMSDLILRRKMGSTKKLSALDKSALLEIGNIVSGNFLSVLANEMKIKIIEEVPIFSFDMFGAIINQVVASFHEESEKTLIIEILFNFKKQHIKAYYLLLFEVEQFEAILDSLKSLDNLKSGTIK